MKTVRLASLWLAAAASVAVAPGCGGFSEVPRAASLTVANLSNFEICHVFTNPTNRMSTPHDRLREGQRIGPDQVKTFPIRAGVWNVTLMDCGRRPLYARGEVRIHGTYRLEFRPIDVQRDLMFGSRRFADGPGRGHSL